MACGVSNQYGGCLGGLIGTDVYSAPPSRASLQVLETTRIRQSRATIREDLKLIETALEEYALGVLTWIEGDRHPTSLADIFRRP